MTMTDKQTNHPSGCDDLVDVLYEYVDGGCDEYLRGRLAEHAENCPSCLEQLGIEQQVRQLLRVRCCDSAPTDLRGRIVTALHTSSVRRAADGSVIEVSSTQVRINRR